MNSYGYAVLCAAALLLAGPATAQMENTWQVLCDVDAMTDQQYCDVYYAALVDTPRLILQINQDPNGDPYIFLHPQTGLLCKDIRPMVRVDRNKAFRFYIYKEAGVLGPDDGARLVEQFVAGSQAVVRENIEPNCSNEDIPVTLREFTAAWREYLATDP